MKKHFAILLTLLLLLNGCSAPVQEQEEQIQFYYCTTEDTFEVDAVSIRSEMRDCTAFESWEEIIRIYLSGPESDGFLSPFPADLKLISLTQVGDTVAVTLSEELAKLSGLQLTMACSCLAMTVLDLTDAEAVRIASENSLLNGQETVTFDRNTILLQDSAAEEE